MAPTTQPTHTAPAAPWPTTTWAFWTAYTVQMRPYLLFVSGITGVAGLALASEASWGRIAALAPVFFLSYGFGQALTDCFQMDTDALSLGRRPLVDGELRRRDVLRVSVAGLLICGAVMVACDLWTVPLVGLCIAGLATYSAFKRRWWAGPFYNGWIVAGLFAVAVLGGDTKATLQALARPAVGYAAAAVFFGYANFVLTGYFKDVSADWATGVETMPVRFGFRVSAWVSDGLAGLTVGCTWLAVDRLLGATTLEAWPPGVFLAAGIAAVVGGQVRLHAVCHEDEAHQAIAPVVHAYLLLLSAVASAARPAWALPLAVIYVAFVATLRTRPTAEQI